MVQAKYTPDPLQGIGGLMTRARTKRIKEALQGLIMEVRDNEFALEGAKDVLQVSK